MVGRARHGVGADVDHAVEVEHRDVVAVHSGPSLPAAARLLRLVVGCRPTRARVLPDRARACAGWPPTARPRPPPVHAAAVPGTAVRPARGRRPRHGHLAAVRRPGRRDGPRPGGREPSQHRPADSVTALRAALPGCAGPAARSGGEQVYLRADDEPALYVYEYTVDGTTVRGLIGAGRACAHEDERVILPHEDVMPAPSTTARC